MTSEDNSCGEREPDGEDDGADEEDEDDEGEKEGEDEADVGETGFNRCRFVESLISSLDLRFVGVLFVL
jgi:hypothetical protein